MSTLDERIAKASAELDARRGPGPFDCDFCGMPTKNPCELANCMECQNFGYYPPRRTPKQGEGELRYVEDASVPGGYRLERKQGEGE